MYCIVCPDGMEYDYVYSKKEADKDSQTIE
jgi:hypothetical protein